MSFVKSNTLFLLALFAPLLGIQGCAKTQADSNVQLLFWSSTNPHEIEHAEYFVNEWNAEHPDTQVVLQPLPEGRSGEEVLIIAAAGGTAPDICSNLPPVIVPLLANAGALVPVDRFEGGREYLAERLPGDLLKTFVASNDSLYQIPWKGNPIVIQYNLGLLEQFGVTEIPRTWSEWEAIAEKVTTDLDGDGQFDRWMCVTNVISEWRQRLFDFYPFYIAAAGGTTLLENGEVSFDSQIFRDVLGFWRRGYIKQYYAKSIATADPFLMGRFAAKITGPWTIAHTERFKPAGFKYGFGPIPVPDDYKGNPNTFGDPKSIGIFSTTRHPEAAWNFCKFYLTRQADLKLLEITGQIPLREGLLEDSLYTGFFATHPMHKMFAEMVPHTRGFDQSPVLQEIFDTINAEFDAVCIQGRRSVAEGVERAVKRSKRVLKLRGDKG